MMRVVALKAIAAMVAVAAPLSQAVDLNVTDSSKQSSVDNIPY
jgi:hypothetical protein